MLLSWQCHDCLKKSLYAVALVIFVHTWLLYFGEFLVIVKWLAGDKLSRIGVSGQASMALGFQASSVTSIIYGINVIHLLLTTYNPCRTRPFRLPGTRTLKCNSFYGDDYSMTTKVPGTRIRRNSLIRDRMADMASGLGTTSPSSRKRKNTYNYPPDRTQAAVMDK